MNKFLKNSDDRLKWTLMIFGLRLRLRAGGDSGNWAVDDRTTASC